jgi:hypothetical protein
MYNAVQRMDAIHVTINEHRWSEMNIASYFGVIWTGTPLSTIQYQLTLNTFLQWYNKQKYPLSP